MKAEKIRMNTQTEIDSRISQTNLKTHVLEQTHKTQREIFKAEQSILLSQETQNYFEKEQELKKKNLLLETETKQHSATIEANFRAFVNDLKHKEILQATTDQLEIE